MADDLISRQAAILSMEESIELINRALNDMYLVGIEREKYMWGLGLLESEIEDLKALPSAQNHALNEWCTDCKEFDSEKHCCHRFRQVILKTVKDLEAQKKREWIPVEERLPEPIEDQPVHVTYTIRGGYYTALAYYSGYDSNWYEALDGVRDDDPMPMASEVVAWMPIDWPKPYKKEDET